MFVNDDGVPARDLATEETEDPSSPIVDMAIVVHVFGFIGVNAKINDVGDVERAEGEDEDEEDERQLGGVGKSRCATKLIGEVIGISSDRVNGEE